ncbi:MAG: ABC transporter permease [Oscillospiraceae bacterium]|jgi:peptide/nickel transport system permease protein|nr:ABC transporter permease [Oscillospiraceae bacterium]
MLKFISKRIVLSVGLFLILTFVLFIMLSFLPSYADNEISSHIQEYGSITKEQELSYKAQYGLDSPVVTRYVKWVKSLFAGTWSYTFTNRSTTVLSVIQVKIGETLILMSSALIVGVVIAIPLGMLAAVKPGGIADNIANVVTFIGVSLPGFIIAIFLIYIFSARLNILPSMVLVTSKYPYAVQMILPVVCVSLHIVGPVVKQVRGSMLDVMNAEYIKTARSKGISERRVIFKHVFRNATIPVTTQIGLSVPMLVGGSVVVEQIFTINGIGRTLVVAINSPSDIPVVMGIVTIQVLVVLVVNLSLDIIYTLLDPRVAY